MHDEGKHSATDDSHHARVRELGPQETKLAYDAMLELREDIGGPDTFERTVNETLRPEGYRLIGAFEQSAERSNAAVAVAGFRLGHMLARGRYLYVDDLVTLRSHRKAGHAAALMAWVFDEARRLRSDGLYLDSATTRYAAHRFYLKHGLVIAAFHFATRL